MKLIWTELNLNTSTLCSYHNWSQQEEMYNGPLETAASNFWILLTWLNYWKYIFLYSLCVCSLCCLHFNRFICNCFFLILILICQSMLCTFDRFICFFSHLLWIASFCRLRHSADSLTCFSFSYWCRFASLCCLHSTNSFAFLFLFDFEFEFPVFYV